MAKDSAVPTSFTDEDLEPYTPTVPLAERSFAELTQQMDVAHIADVDDRVQLEKDSLVGQPFVITDFRFSQGDYGPDSQFVVVQIVTPQGPGFFTDGSTGIKDQLVAYGEKAARNGMDFGEVVRTKGMLVPRGLRVSRYFYTDEKGESLPAATYYLDNRS